MLDFVGREQETSEISNAWSQRKPVFVYGESGIGKTELVTFASTVNKVAFSRGDLVFADRFSEPDTCCFLKDVFDDSISENRDVSSFAELLKWLKAFDLSLNRPKVCFFDELGYLEEYFDADPQTRHGFVSFLTEAITFCKNINFAFAAISPPSSSEASRVVSLCRSFHLKGMSEGEVVKMFVQRSLRVQEEALLLIKQRAGNSPRHIQRIVISSMAAKLKLVTKKDVERYLLSVRL